MLYFLQVFISIVILLSSFTLHSQENKTLKLDTSYYLSSNHIQSAKFNYKLTSKGDTIYHGPYYFEQRQVDSINHNGQSVLKKEGLYKDGVKNGLWNSFYWTHRIKLIDVIKSDKIEYDIETVKEEVHARFKGGVPDGAWEYIKSNLVNDSLISKSMVVKVAFSNGHVNDSIEIEGVDSTGNILSVKGFSVNGLMDGNWDFRYSSGGRNYTESRVYRKGFLTELYKIDIEEADTTKSMKYPLSDEIIKYLEESKNKVSAVNVPLSIVFSDGYPRNHQLITLQYFGNDILKDAIDKVLKFEQEYYKNFGLPIGTNRMIYPITEREKNLLELWPDLIAEYERKINLIEVEINLDEVKPPKQMAILQEWSAMQANLLDYIRPWNAIFSSDEIVYYNRTGLILDYMSDRFLIDTLSLDQFQDIVIEYPVVDLEEKGLFSFIVKNISERIKYADTLIVAYHQVKEKLKGQIVLDNEVTSIKDIKSKLDSTYRGDILMGNVKIVLYETINLHFLNSWFREKFNAVTDSVRDLDSRILMAHSLKADLNAIATWRESINSILSRYRVMDSLYTDYVFDPFTFNERFPVRLKKRLYEFAIEDVYRLLIMNAQEARTIDDFQRALYRIKALFDRMESFADENTREIERKISNKLTLNEKLSLLKIE